MLVLKMRGITSFYKDDLYEGVSVQIGSGGLRAPPTRREVVFKSKPDVVLEENIKSMHAISEQAETGGGMQGAATGALLGFLVAGPVGTAIGAGLGAKSYGQNSARIGIELISGGTLILDDVSPEELAALKQLDILSAEARSSIQTVPKNISTSNDTDTDSASVRNRLAQLKELFNEGLIDENEFSDRKKKLLDEI